MNTSVVTKELASKVLEVVNHGLTSGLGHPVPGQMCVEAAVCYAMGLPHSDKPTCVGAAVRTFKIRMNDMNWSSNAKRTEGLRKLAIAQLGSDSIDQATFARVLAEQTIRKIVPLALRAAKKAHKQKAHQKALEQAAKNCEKEGTLQAAAAAASASYAYAADAAAYAAAYAAADAAAYAAADAAAYAADANVAAYAADAAKAASAAASYAAASSYAASADADAANARDEVFMRMCEIGLNVLIELGSPGCAYLFLIDEMKA